MRSLVLLALATLAAPTPAGASPDRVSLLLGSHHVAASLPFNEANPGIFLTWEKPSVDWSVGVYRNSFNRTSVAATVAIPLIAWEAGELSAFVGVAHYPQDGRTFAVHVGDFVPVGGLQLRSGSVFAQVIPSDGKTASAIVSVGLTFSLDD